MKRIYLLTDSLGSGGAQRQIVGLAALLKEHGHEVLVGYYHPIHFYQPFLNKHCVPYQFIPNAVSGWKRIECVRQSIKAFQPDTVISYLDTPNIIACLLRVMGLKFRLITSERNTTQKLSCREYIKFFLMRMADSIVPNSFSQGKYICNHFSRLAPKVTIITNFVDTNTFSPGSQQKDRDTERKLRLLVVGRVTEQKNVMLFLLTVKRLRDEGHSFFVDWYGYSGNDSERKWTDFIRNERLDMVFKFHEPSQDIVARYREADILVLPSIYEGFPNVLCEAMSCGLPVACSNVCDNPMIVEDGKNGFLFDPLSVDDMVEKLLRLLTLSDYERRTMGHRSREIALHLFSADKFAEAYENLI